VLYLGRLHYKKQPDVAIRAFAKLRAGFPEAHLVMAGEGEAGYVAELRRLAGELGLAGSITFTGPLLGEEKLQALSAASVFLLPSLRENFGIAVAEAMAAGCPVVVSPGVDIAEEISRAEAGLVCSPEPGLFAEALAKILNSPGLSSSMGQNGKKLTSEKYRWTKIVGELTGIYAGILAAKRYN
jgi:glycosyltransferase involved in cell wall biosynthesis